MEGKNNFFKIKLVHGTGIFSSMRTRVVDFLFFNNGLLNLNSGVKG